MGALVRDYGKPGMAVPETRPSPKKRRSEDQKKLRLRPLRSGVYAMVGSASMLAGFKQMAVAVVVFITGAS